MEVICTSTAVAVCGVDAMETIVSAAAFSLASAELSSGPANFSQASAAQLSACRQLIGCQLQHKAFLGFCSLQKTPDEEDNHNRCISHVENSRPGSTLHQS